MQFTPRQLEDLYNLIKAERAETDERHAAEKVALAVLIDIDTKIYAKLNALGANAGNMISVSFTKSQLAALAWLYEEWCDNLPYSLHRLLSTNHRELA